MNHYTYPTPHGTFAVDAVDLAHALPALRAAIIRSGAAVAFPQTGWLTVEPWSAATEKAHRELVAAVDALEVRLPGVAE